MVEKRFRFCGGHPVLDFVNTVAWRLGATPAEKLTSYDDLVRWARQAGMMDAGTVATLRQKALRSPEAARRVLARAMSTREMFYRLSDAQRRRRRPASSDIEQLNRAVKRIQGASTIQWSGRRYGWVASEPGLDAMLPPLVRAGVELLTSERAHRISQCKDVDGCGWLFLNSSRARARQWCSMADCGNRAKARRHYRRSH